MAKPRYSENVACRHCFNFSKMEIIGTVTDTIDHWDDPHGQGVDFYNCYEHLKCPRCKKINIRQYEWDDLQEAQDDIEVEFEYLYPIGNVPAGLPEAIVKAYNAAEQVKSIDVNAYATLLRRLLEMICHDRSAKPATLAQMLQELADKGEMPQNLVKVATGLRNFGNIGAHAGSGDLSEEEIPIVKALTNAILEYVYSAPHLEKLATAKLDEIKKKKTKK